jgi:hypothetical protein
MNKPMFLLLTFPRADQIKKCNTILKLVSLLGLIIPLAFSFQVGNFTFPTLLPKWGAIYSLESLWDLKSEITSLHFTDFILVKVISL